MLSVPPAFAQAELEYRQQRIKENFGPGPARHRTARLSRTQLRARLTALVRPHRRLNPVARRPLPAPHH